MGLLRKGQSKKAIQTDNSELKKENNLLRNHVKREGIFKKSRGKPPTGLFSGTQVRNGFFEPSVDPRMLILGPENNWMLGAVVEKICIEATKDPKLSEWIPLFEAKCKICGTEYAEAAPEECEKCGSMDFRKADKEQLYQVDKLFKHPNSDSSGHVRKTFKDIIKTLIHYQQTTDDYYLEIGWNLWGSPASIFPMTSEAIRIKGDITDKKWFKKGDKFCPKCYVPDETISDKRDTCKKCGAQLLETAYAQLDGFTNNIVMRWSEDEVIHDNTRAWGNRIYGMPKIWSVWVTAQILKWIEYYQWSAYSKNEMPDSLTVFPEMSQDNVNHMISDAISYKMEHPEARKNMWLGAESGTPPVHIKIMPTLVDMDAVGMAQYLREAIGIRYGVSLNMLGIQTPGKLGKETEQIEVSMDTIVEAQTQINECINTKLLPLFKHPEITEWRFALISPKKDDEVRKAQIKNMNVSTVVSLRSSGIDAAIDVNTWEPEIRDQPAPPEPGAFGGMEFSASNIEYPDGSKVAQYHRNHDYLSPFFYKGRTYIKDPKDAPKGVTVHEGERGGYYYEDGTGRGGKKPDEMEGISALSEEENGWRTGFIDKYADSVREHSATITKDGGWLSVDGTKLNEDGVAHISYDQHQLSLIKKAKYHSHNHPKGSAPMFSRADIRFQDKYNIPICEVFTDGGSFKLEKPQSAKNIDAEQLSNIFSEGREAYFNGLSDREFDALTSSEEGHLQLTQGIIKDVNKKLKPYLEFCGWKLTGGYYDE